MTIVSSIVATRLSSLVVCTWVWNPCSYALQQMPYCKPKSMTWN